jgi:hypothetical protein
MYHIIHRDFFDYWGSIHQIVLNNGLSRLVTQNPIPGGIAKDDWARSFSWGTYNNSTDPGAYLGYDIGTWLSADAANHAVIDELFTGKVANVTRCIDFLRANFPSVSPRWSVLVAHPSGSWDLANAATAIDLTLGLGAGIGLQQYVNIDGYCAIRGSQGTAAADAYLRDHFRGYNGQRWLAWLVQRRSDLGSSSRITNLFGVTNAYVGDVNGYRYLDRMFYVFRTQSGYAGLMSANAGGIGSYKWENTPGDAQRVQSTNRDELFRESWNHYCGTFATSARYTAVC